MKADGLLRMAGLPDLRPPLSAGACSLEVQRCRVLLEDGLGCAGQNPNRFAPVNIRFNPTTTDSKEWCTHQKMVPLVLTHSHVSDEKWPRLEIYVDPPANRIDLSRLREKRGISKKLTSKEPKRTAVESISLR